MSLKLGVQELLVIYQWIVRENAPPSPLKLGGKWGIFAIDPFIQ